MTSKNKMSQTHLIWKRLRHNKMAVLGMLILVLITGVCLIGPFLDPYSSDQMFYEEEVYEGVYLIDNQQEVFMFDAETGVLRWSARTSEAYIETIETNNQNALAMTLDNDSTWVLDPNTGQELLKVPESSMTEDDALSYETTYEISESGEFEAYDSKGNNIWSIWPDVSSNAEWIHGSFEEQVLLSKGNLSIEHWLGTDQVGLDVFTRLMYGGRLSLSIALSTVFLEVLLGVSLGLCAGYAGGIVDGFIMRIIDVLLAIPPLPIMLVVGSMNVVLNMPSLGRIVNLIFILTFLGWPYPARIVRGQVMTLKQSEAMTALRVAGIKTRHQLTRHLLPGVMPQVIVLSTLEIGNMMLLESTLSYLGIGLSFPFASWGNMVNSALSMDILKRHTNIWLPAGICILLTVLSFNLVGEALRDAYDPRQKGGNQNG